MKDYFKILNITPNAPQEVINGAYKELYIKYHPNLNSDTDADQKFKEINEAFLILSDPIKKREYILKYLDFIKIKKEILLEKAIKEVEENIANKKGNIERSIQPQILKKQEKFTTQIKRRLISLLTLLILPALILGSLGILILVSGNINNEPKTNIPSGEIYNTKEKKAPKPKEDYSNWETPSIKTGNSPDCYNFSIQKDKSINNKLQISVGNNTDVVIKLINSLNNKCIRYVYVKSGETFNIRNIPEGIYFTKIAYGNDWKQKVANGKCFGKFTKNAIYKRGETDFNFYIQYTENGYSIPSYSLKLDVTITDLNDNYSTNGINEDEFNN